MPRAEVALETAMDSMVSVRATVWPREWASAMRSAVSSGVLVCTKCTSALSLMPAAAMALRTPAATLSTIGRRPISSGRIGSDTAKPTARRFSSAGSAGPSTLANTVMCGEITPSQPPDQAIGTCRASARLLPACSTRKSRSTRSASTREKSLTPPLPSTLPMRATISSAAKSPSAMAASRPLVSWTFSKGILRTT